MEQRYFVRSPDGRLIAGYELREAAVYTALEYGDGALLVDHGAQRAAQDADGASAADIAGKRGRMEILALLKPPVQDG